MSGAGFLGTRADLPIDLGIVALVGVTIVMLYALRLAAQGRHDAHRKVQAGLLAVGLVSVLVLEFGLRFGIGAAAYAKSAYYGTWLMTGLFIFHLAVAIPTFLVWCVLACVSWRRFAHVLPGQFSRSHRRFGRATYFGLWVTSVSGVIMYVMAYRL